MNSEMNKDHISTIRQALEKAQSNSWVYPDSTPVLAYRTLITDALASLDKLEGIGEGWISVKDRLPVGDQSWVLVCADGAMNCAWYYEGEWTNGYGERPRNIIIEEITHWMPLPAPPEVEHTPEQK